MTTTTTTCATYMYVATYVCMYVTLVLVLEDGRITRTENSALKSDNAPCIESTFI